MEKSSDSRPHVMVFPFIAQGHIIVMMHFARKLAAQGILVSFVTTQHQLQRMRLLQPAAGEADSPSSSEAEIHGIRLLGLDDGLPADHPRLPYDIEVIRAVESLGGQLEELLLQAGDGGSSLPTITCLVSDSFLPWTQPIAHKCGVPRALFWTQSLAVCSSYWSTSKIIASGDDPFRRRVKRRGERPLIGFIPGLPEMDPYDLPFNSEMEPAEEETESGRWLRSVVESQFSDTVDNAAWFIANSSQALEGSIAQGLHSSSLIPSSKLLLLGPLCNDLPPQVPSSRSIPWEDDHDGCLPWLDSQKDASILYISFGSIVVRAHAINDVAMALLACRQPFLWVQGSGREAVRACVNDEFWEFAMEAGKFTTWAPQVKVLAHRAVGGFFTHAGWNSTIESISKGVPMLAWPCFLDQYTNSWAIARLWKIGLQVMREEGNDTVKELEGAIWALMQGPQSKVFRERASQLASASSSSHHEHFALFVEDMVKRATTTR